jgi:hypothetical protein
MECYGKYFAEMIEANVKTLMLNDRIRERNPQAPFPFGENDFRKHLRSGAYDPPPDWPDLAIERRVKNDTEGHGGVDYFLFLPSATSQKHDLNEVLATCEVGGPTRPIFLRGSRRNW